jgi:hypothetical protein
MEVMNENVVNENNIPNDKNDNLETTNVKDQLAVNDTIDDKQKAEEKVNDEVQKTNSSLSVEEKATINKMIEKSGLPKGVQYFIDKEDNLKFIVPINGQKYVGSLSEVIKGFNLAQAGYQNLDKSKNIEKEVKDFFGKIKSNPDELFEIAKKLGHDPYDLAKKMLEKRLEDLNLSPEERARRESEREKESLRKELEELRLEKENAKLNAEVKKEEEKIGAELLQAMKKHGFDNKNIKTKSNVMAAALGKVALADRNGHQLSVEDAVYLVKQEWQTYILDVMNELDENHILDIIPESVIKTIRKSDLSRLSQGIPTSANIESIGQRVNLQPLNKTQKQTKKIGMAEYFDTL